MAARSFVVISNARSGSTQLIEYINQIPGCFCFGEVFSHQFRSLEYSNAVIEPMGDRAEVLNLHKDDASEFWRRLITAYDERYDWIGAKIFYWHRVGDPVWETFFDPSMPVIHLWRRGTVDSFISLLLAEETGQWISRKGAEPSEGSKTRVHFPVKRYLEYREFVQNAFRDVNERISAHTQVMHVEYDEIGRPSDLAARLGAFFGAEITLKETLRKQMTGAPRDLVSNPEDITPYLNDRLDQDFSS